MPTSVSPPGRAAMLDTLVTAVCDGAGAVVSGRAGIGKTKLVGALTGALATRGLNCYTIFGTASAQRIPLAALAPLLPGSDGADGLQLARARERVRARLAALGAHVLVVDDADQIDGLSASVVRHLAEDAALRLVLVVRRLDDVPQMLRPLVDERLQSLVLEPLDLEAATEAVEQYLGGQLASPAAVRLQLLSDGIPLTLVQLLRVAVDSGALAQRRGVWQLEGRLPAAQGLDELLATRLGDLDDDQRTALELLAISEPLDLETLERLSSCVAIERLERAGLLRVRGTPGHQRVTIGHPLFAEWLASALPRSRRTRLASQLARRLEGRPDADPLRVAMIRVHAGLETDPRQLLEAGLAAVQLDWQLAYALLDAAVRSGGGAPAVLALAQLCELARPEEARALLAGLQTAELTDDERANVLALTAFVATLTADEASVRAALGSSLERPDGAPPPIRLAAAAARLFSGDAAGAFSYAEPSLRDATLPAPLRWMAVLVCAAACATAGPLELAVHIAREAIDEIAAHDPSGSHASSVVSAAALAHERRGELDAAEALARATLARSSTRGDAPANPRMTQCLARVALCHGQPARAARLMREVLADLRGADEIFSAWNLSLLAVADAMRGEPRLAASAIEQMDAVPASLAIYRPEQELFRAEVLACGGDLAAARSAAAHAATVAELLGQPPVAMLAWHALARFGDPRGAVRGLRAAVPAVDGPLAPVLLRNVERLVEADAAGVLECADSLVALGFRPLAAHAYAASARLAARAGTPKLAAQAASRLDWLRKECDALVLPPPAGSVVARSLTARELDVAALAADGATDREIARRLGVSLRTVHTHLGHVYAKTQISGRRELAGVLDWPTQSATDAPAARHS